MTGLHHGNCMARQRTVVETFELFECFKDLTEIIL